MIEFSCRQCGKQFKLDDSKAGKRGKCPQCSTIMVVPDKSENDLIFVDDDNFFSDKELNKFYRQFLKEYESYIYQHQISTSSRGDAAKFEIATGRGRSQLVWLVNFKADDVSWIVIYSIVGKIRLMESAVHALKAVDLFAPYGISLDDDNCLNLSQLTKISNLDQELFNRTIAMVASKADELEETLFGIDRF